MFSCILEKISIMLFLRFALDFSMFVDNKTISSEIELTLTSPEFSVLVLRIFSRYLTPSLRFSLSVSISVLIRFVAVFDWLYKTSAFSFSFVPIFCSS